MPGKLNRIDVLERQVQSLKAQMPSRSIYCSSDYFNIGVR